MKIIYHNNAKVVAVVDKLNSEIPISGKQSPVEVLLELAKTHPDAVLVWCHESLKNDLNIDAIEGLFTHQKMLLSYNPSDDFFLGSAIGYIEESIYINVKKAVSFATWQMSGAVGAMHSSVVNALRNEIDKEDNLDYLLTSIAKLAMPIGLLCYSEPKLLKSGVTLTPIDFPKVKNIFKFVKQHYKARWVLLLLFDIVVYEKRLPFLPFVRSFFYKKRSFSEKALDSIALKSLAKNVENTVVDILIPTIGRKKELYDVLDDFRKQTLLPDCIIIVEQNPLPESESELDYLNTETWPFTIKHTFIHQSGACNARNIALGQITGEWVFLADDDIRITPDFLQKTLENISKCGGEAVYINCLQKGEKQKHDRIVQWPYFGTACSFVLAEKLKGNSFLMGYEFGFGEDIDFGMQLRNKGCDVLYLPEPTILHLKAPVGGFRTKPVLRWSQDEIQPKPSPMTMLYKLLHYTKEQLMGYKTTLFLNYYSHQPIKNPLRYYSNFKKKWNRSVYWAEKLKQD